MSSGGAIPGNMRRMIQDIKEIAGNHGDEEVYAVLKECSMDPNETAQRLLFQDTFHEVKRKRDKRKENNKESADSRWRSGVEGRGGRGGRANYSSRHVANGGARSVYAGRVNGAEKVNANITSPLVHNAEIKSRIPMQSSFGAHANGISNVKSSFSSHGSGSRVSYVNCMAKEEEIFTTNSNKKGGNIDSKISSVPSQHVPVSAQLQSSMIPSYDSEVYVSSSEPAGPVLVPNLDVGAPGVVGSTKSEGGSHSAVDNTVKKVVSHDFADSEFSYIGSKGSSEIGNNYMHGKSQIKSPRNETKQPLDVPLPMPASSLAPSISSRPSSNYSNRSQQLSSLHKAGPNKEWKPTTSHVNTAHSSALSATSEISAVTVEVVGHSVPALSSTASENDVPNLQKRLERLHFLDTGGVIIPDHLQVPDFNKYSLRFGSFDANYEPGASFLNGSNSDMCSTPLSELAQEIDENIEQPPSGQIAPPTVEEATYLDDFQSSTLTLENLASRESDISSEGSILQEHGQSKPEPTLAAEVPQHSIVQTALTYPTLNLTPQMLGGQFAGFEGTENHPRDASHLPSFVSGNSLVPSSTGPNLAVSQAAGAMQSAIPVTLQPVPLFRQPAGVHLAHYHPNYVPYNQFLSPIFVQPAATIHPFLSSTTFPQQTPAGGMFTPPAAAASPTSVKYTLPQYKPGNNTVNSTHIGMLTSYGTYSSTPVGYNPNLTGTSGNSNNNEDLTASSQFKENNVYMTAQQSDGLAVWVATPGHDISALQASSFYNLPPHQHLTFAPSQAGHGAFPSIYHPTQTVMPTAVHPLLPQSQPMAGAMEMVGPPAGVYQPPQCTQINWANNY